MGTYKSRLKKRDPSVEYSVYIFHPVYQNDNHMNHVAWEKRHTTFSMRAAMRNAEKLYSSDAYERVEVKKIFFDQKSARKIDKTLKIYQKKPVRPVGMLVKAGLVLAGAVAVFAATILTSWRGT